MQQVLGKLVLFFVSFASVLSDETVIQSFASDTSLFAGAVYNEIIVGNRYNLLVSSFSVENVLAMTQAGAVGDTAKEIRSTLRLPDTEEETERVFKSVLPTLHSDNYTLTTANKIYVEDNFIIKDQFKKVVTGVFEAAIENIEFAQNVQAAQVINDWVAEQTDNKIQNLLVPSDLDSGTRVVLVNALYFKGNWAIPFAKSSLRQKFYTTADETIDADFMHIDFAFYNYYESDELDAQILELPFEGNDATLTVILPNKKEGIAVLERQIPSVLSTPTYSQETVLVQLPKFKIETNIKFKNILQKLGVRKAFDPLTADFSGIGGLKGDLAIYEIIQKTYINVNENGVEAAAATATVALEVTSAQHTVPRANKRFIADHPFIFYIKVNGVILFEGRLLNP